MLLHTKQPEPWKCDRCGSPDVTTRYPVMGGYYVFCTACADTKRRDDGQPIDWIKHNLRLYQSYDISPNIKMVVLILKKKVIDDGYDWKPALARWNLTDEERDQARGILAQELNSDDAIAT